MYVVHFTQWELATQSSVCTCTCYVYAIVCVCLCALYVATHVHMCTRWWLQKAHVPTHKLKSWKWEAILTWPLINVWEIREFFIFMIAPLLWECCMLVWLCWQCQCCIICMHTVGDLLCYGNIHIYTSCLQGSCICFYLFTQHTCLHQ